MMPPTPSELPEHIEFKTEREIKLFILVIIALSDGVYEFTEELILKAFGKKHFPLEESYFNWLLNYYIQYRASYAQKAEEIVVMFCKSDEYFNEEQKAELLHAIIDIIEADGKVSFSEGLMLRRVKHLLVN